MNRAEICARIPHSGSMCLLEQVTAWDETSIDCRASSHRDAANPLRSQGQLPAVCAVEYAAQAMAVHGSLIGPAQGSGASAGFLASVRDLKLAVDRLDTVTGDLHIHADRLDGSDSSFIYEFAVRDGEVILVSGRVAVMLMGAAA